MKKIAVLGPKGTYSDVAKENYLKNTNEEFETVYYPSIIKAINAIDDNTIAIVPFENSLDGFILESLDKMISNKLNVLSQIKLSIDFAFVANVADINDVKEVYCQFKSYGQCLDFITAQNFSVIKTESNIESLVRFKEAKAGYGAIIPMHALTEEYPLVIKHISDSKNNETRFFVLNNKGEFNIDYKNDVDASVVITSILDRPGILFDILKRFHDESINLKSILSRPDKTGMGNYNFYIECSLGKNVNRFNKLLHNFVKENEYKVTLLGIYEVI